MSRLCKELKGVLYVLLTVVFLFITTNSFAQSKYVSETGSDNSNDCSVLASPCATIQQAIDSSSVGDSVFVESGTYDSFSTSFGGPSGIYIKGEVGAKIVLAHSETLQRIIDLRADSTTFTGFIVKGGGTHVGVSVSGKGITVSNNTIDSVLTGIQTTTQYIEGNTAITGNTITNSDYGISLQNNSNLVTGNDINITTEGFGIGSASNTITGNDLEIGSGGVQVQTYSGGSLPGADIDLSAMLLNNEFNKYAIVKDNSGLKIETIFGDIQDAIDSAVTGDTVSVGNGTYVETVSISTNNVTVTGQVNTEVQVSRNEIGISISSDSVTIKNLKITGPYDFNFNTVDWDTLPNAFGITINGSASKTAIDGNTISNLRTGISFVSSSAGSATNNTIDNTKGSFIIRTDDAQLTGNSIGSTGSEWDIVFLTGVTANGYTASPITDEEGYSSDILSLSTSNGGMKVLDRRYGSNGILDNTSTIGNRSHIYISAGSSFTASDDFDFGNGLGNLRQPLGNIDDGITGVVIGGTVNVQSGTYSEQHISVKKDSISLNILSGVSGIDTLTLDTSVKKLSLAGNDTSLVIIGNTEDNIFTISGGASTIDGGTGTDQVVLAGNRHEYSITDNSGSFTLADNRTNSPNGETGVSNIEQAAFDNITIALSIGEPVAYPGASLRFPTNSSEVEVPDDTSIQLTDSLTIEFWIKVDGFDSADQTIIKKGDSSWSIHRSSSTNFIAFTTYISAASHTLTGTISVNDAKWHHITAVFTGSDKLLYIDGILDVEASISGNLDSNTDAITLGGFAGNIDELRIWGASKNAESIRASMFQPIKVDETDLVSYWRMDEGSGSVVSDLTSNKNDISIGVSSDVSWSEATYPTGSFITGDEGWRIITSPSSGLTYAQILDGLWTQGFTGASTTSGTPSVYAYTEGDGGTDASERGFKAINSLLDVPSEGQALLVYVYEDNDVETEGVQGGFPKTLRMDSTQRSGSVAPSLSLTKSGAGGTFDSSNDGWNLIGNPYASTIDWDESNGWTRTGLDDAIYVWSDSAEAGTGAYLSWNGVTGTLGSGKISPMQGFWVKANNSGSPALALNDTVRSSGATLLKQKTIPELKFRLSEGGLSNRAIIMFSEAGEVGKDRFDAYKLASNNTEWLSVSTSVLENGGAAMDIQSLPVSAEQIIEMSLDVSGSNLISDFNLSWNAKHLPEYMNIELWDTEKDQKFDLSQDGSFDFDILSNPKAVPYGKEDLASPPQSITPQPISYKASATQSRFRVLIKNIQTVIDESGDDIPDVLELNQNYPNPFNPTTMIEFGLPDQSRVTLEVFDILGRKVARLLNNELKNAGRYEVNFDARNLASGIYIYRITTGDTNIAKKMTILK